MCELLGIKQTRTTPYNPRSDGMVERLNQTLIDQLAKPAFLSGGVGLFSQAGHFYNTSVHASTGFTPFFLTHGREARIPAYVLLGSHMGAGWGNASLVSFAASLRAGLDIAFRRAQDTAQDRQKAHYDSNMRHRPYEVGDLVWLNDPTESRLKLAPHWKGLYRVQGRLDVAGDVGVTYELASPLEVNSPLIMAHYKRLRPYTLPWPASPRGLPRDEMSLTQPVEEPRSNSPLPQEPRNEDCPVVAQPAEERTSRAGRAVHLPGHLRDFVVINTLKQHKYIL